jgi:hypothetical protein
MPNLYPNLDAEVASPDSNTANMCEYISVGEALKLVTPFKDEKREVQAFIANVTTAFEVIDPRNEGTLFKFVLTRIRGEPRSAIAHRNLENLEELKEFLKNTYTEKRTLDYHANQLFSTKQSKGESVSDWIQRVQKLGSKFREAALQDCEQDEKAGILTLADKLRNICFVQGLYSDRLQSIVRSRNHASFDDIAETALEEEIAIFSKNERYKSNNAVADGPRCSSCNKLGHVASRCYLRDTRKDTRFSQLTVKSENRGKSNEVICYNCQGKGHIARNRRKPKRHFDKPGLYKDRTGEGTRPGNESRPSENGSRPTVQSTQ